MNLGQETKQNANLFWIDVDDHKSLIYLSKTRRRRKKKYANFYSNEEKKNEKTIRHIEQ